MKSLVNSDVLEELSVKIIATITSQDLESIKMKLKTEESRISCRFRDKKNNRKQEIVIERAAETVPRHRENITEK
ncbi:hypothetical protein SK128_016069 [Halocaridina rubra]|uniref:Uncharacterized protein n=1 Tax=Halocaridina rubra TaxID=373956 RepID=A0AAN8WJS6_HALRR